MTTPKRHEAKETVERTRLLVHLGEVLSEARRARGLTQADVAERVGIATEVYGRTERGLMLPSVPTLRRLCGILRLDANHALDLAGHDMAAWLADAAPTQENPPLMRRLLRHLRHLDEPRLAVVHNLVLALEKLPSGSQPSAGEEGRESRPFTS
ncbi:helix-turn-helix domain-containing protein [Archangium lipolyticum]|uniref:helix-turn-helix domain-containing protein n=1 Tax=Archangium lipolyticum TaxID=2970465 RepID=UPI00214A7AFA|nr:helix-turn-helix transcriptional regulator [Archangium lipolyticum]